METSIDEMEFIDEHEVPNRSEKTSRYLSMFKKIPKGKSLVLTEPKYNLSSIRQALRGLKQRGICENLISQQRTVAGTTKMYITNPSKDRQS